MSTVPKATSPSAVMPVNGTATCHRKNIEAPTPASQTSPTPAATQLVREKRSNTVAEQTDALLADTVGKLGLTAVMAKTLWAIEPSATPSMRQLAADLSCDPSTVTFLADRLQEKGLITREIDPANRRAKIVSLTERGLEIRRQLGIAMLTRSPVAHLSTAEQRQLNRLLTKGRASETHRGRGRYRSHLTPSRPGFPIRPRRPADPRGAATIRRSTGCRQEFGRIWMTVRLSSRLPLDRPISRVRSHLR
ncbi:DNA-binding MarR family transcriptional regulator [Nocardia sp. GAS34]|uniref:MarR family winged helix-turn-helix transcriptional regulator n=1 Tax=unclassified Nocardia TaxID=2637762 RepID=UPI003D20AE71